MTSAETVTLLAAVGVLITSISTAVIGIITVIKIEKVRHATNSITEQLVATTKSEAHAAGVKEEKDKKS